jgi:ParB family chromosome partitioning protein
MPQKSGLGRGLGALIPGGENGAGDNGIMLVPVGKVSPNPRQPRSSMHPDELDELTVSIREHGVLQPLIVTEGAKAGEYILIAGERRWLAARQAGLREIPAMVREATDAEALELALNEGRSLLAGAPLAGNGPHQRLVGGRNQDHSARRHRVRRPRSARPHACPMV